MPPPRRALATRRSARAALCALGALSALARCASPPAPDAPASDATLDAPAPDAPASDTPRAPPGPTTCITAQDPAAPTFCSLGTDVPGAQVPAGFCLRRYATVGSPRVLSVACNGDVFVAAPHNGAPGGSGDGPGAVMVLADDDRDGTAEVYRFSAPADRTTASLLDVHGLVVARDAVYFTTDATVYRTAYATGQRSEDARARVDLHMPPGWAAGVRWTHGLALSPGGTLLGSRGHYGLCGQAPASGEISRLAMNTMAPLATGFRNPMYLRCHFRDEVCLATELGEDQIPGAREKLVQVRASTGYGYPCCYTTGLGDPVAPAGACAGVTREDFELPLGHTPFGFDWERGAWPEPWRGGIFLALHGSFYTTPAWQGAGIAMLATDPTTHLPREHPAEPPANDPGFDAPYFVQGFGPDGSSLERPADVVFSPDGRMFFADDLGNAVYWVAPTALHLPQR